MIDYSFPKPGSFVLARRAASLHLCRAVAAALAACCLATAAQAGFFITDLGANNIPAAISASGAYVVGQNAAGHAFLYDASAAQMHDLGTLGGAGSQANGVNDSGQVVGQADGVSNTTAFLYSGGTMQSLGTLPGAATSSANAINNAGQIVGSSGTIGNTDAFIYDSVHGMNDIVGTDIAYGINASGLVTGDEPYHAFNSIAFLYDSGALSPTKQDLVPGGGFSQGFAINAAGDVVGVAELSADDVQHAHFHAFLYDTGGYHNLGQLAGYNSSEARGINTVGQVVGDSYNTGGAGGRAAFLYSGGTMTDLTSQLVNGAGWSLKYAYAISDGGQIVGEGDYHGVEHGFLLNPEAVATPEPASLALWGFGATGLWLANAVRRRGQCVAGKADESRRGFWPK